MKRILAATDGSEGAMSLGELTQSAAAFVTVQGAFNRVVDNYQRLADRRSWCTASRRSCPRSMRSSASST